MKNLKITLIAITCIFAFACKKEKIEDTTKAIYYKNSPNSLDNLMIEVNMPEKNSVAYFYGSSDSLGAPSTVNSISYKVNSNDTIVNFILDDEKRPQIIYFSNNSGTKLNQLIKFEYISSDSTIISIYNYNWQNNTDSLLFQSRGKGDKAIKTYGLRLNSTTDIGTDILLAFGATGLSIAAVALLPGILFAAAGFTLGQSALAGVIAAATFIASNSNANQQLQTQTNPNAPQSPTSGFIPNPIGTPNYPVGITINWGISITGTDIDGQSPATGSINIRAANRNQVSISYSNSGSSNEVRQILLSNIPSTIEINANFNRSLYITIGPYLLAYPDSQNPDDIGKTSIYSRIYQ